MNQKKPQNSKINRIIREYAQSLMEITGVVGVAESQNEKGYPCIKIMVKQINPEITKKIPDAIEGIPVKIIETGEFVPLRKK